MTVVDAVFLAAMAVVLGYLLTVMLRDGRER